MQISTKKIFKACFMGETKRLKITKDYANLVEQSKGAFGSGLPASFKFFYFDEEDEIISINSQQDLMEALSIEDFGTLKLTIATSVAEARTQLVQQLQQQSNIRDSMSQSGIFNASQQPSGGIDFGLKPLQERKDTFETNEDFDLLNGNKEDMGCGPDTSMSNAIDCGTEAFAPVSSEQGINTTSTVTEAMQTQTQMPTMESMATQSISNTAEMGCEPIAIQNTDFACQIDNQVEHSDMETSCQIIQPEIEGETKPEAQVTCFKCEGTSMNNKGLPCRKCQGTGIIHSDEYAEITTVVREEILQYCKAQFSGMLDNYLQKKRADQAVVQHENVNCNGCQMNPIQGIRYKCSVRDNFNLCEACEAKNVPDHPMLKIRQPAQAPKLSEPVVEVEQAVEEKPINESQMLVHSVMEEAPQSKNKSDKKVTKYQGRFIKENFGDMHSVSGGKEYTKTWTFRNDGDSAWPEDTLFCQIGGDKIECDPMCLNREVLPGQEYDWEVEFTSPQAEGKYTSFFRMVSGQNNRFGHKVWINILVKKDEAEEIQQSAESFGDKQGCFQPIEQEKPIQQVEISVLAKPFTPDPTVITPKMIYENKCEGIECEIRKKCMFELFELGFVAFEKNQALLVENEDNVEKVANLLCEDQ